MLEKIMFKKILIANRGEIALRVIRACREMGIAPVAVYSEADRAALHVRKADEANSLGASTATESYLNIAKIIDAAKRSCAEAIHPGYGFLSENPAFAQACADAGIKFIGPSPASMRMMGSKTSARQHMEKAGVPFVPGTSRGVASASEAQEVAARVGYPVMLKAAAGGGGKGMRLVNAAAELKGALEAARSEALHAFGDDEVYVEKAIANPRHIEMQILADEYGNTLYLGERECSIQRRHQKVLEECPSPIVGAEMRRQMGEIAVLAARAAGYANAGTIEFLVDGHKNFYFLEMNTRLQVEHPVTELVTGIDLVHWQIRIAAGEKLTIRQEELQLRGHAIECRIYAEDPDNNYFPSPGTITSLTEPSGPGIRLDSGIYEGCTVPMEYDPLLAKLVGYGADREEAAARLFRALEEYFVGGIKTNLGLFRRILRNPDFIAAKLDTAFLDRLLKSPPPQKSDNSEIAAVAAGLFALLEPSSSSRTAPNGANRDARQDRNSGQGDTTPAWKRAARLDALQ